MFVVIFVLQF